MLGRHQARHKRFDYTPRYYDPSKDENLKRRMRIKTRARRRSPTAAIWLGLLLILALYIYTHI